MPDTPSIQWLLDRVYPVRGTESRGDYLDDVIEPTNDLAAAKSEADRVTEILDLTTARPVKQYVRLLLTRVFPAKPDEEIIFAGHRLCPECHRAMTLESFTFSAQRIILACRGCGRHHRIDISFTDGYDKE